MVDGGKKGPVVLLFPEYNVALEQECLIGCLGKCRLVYALQTGRRRDLEIPTPVQDSKYYGDVRTSVRLFLSTHVPHSKRVLLHTTLCSRQSLEANLSTPPR